MGTLAVAFRSDADPEALIEIAGVVAHYLPEQTREVGIRMALGARSAAEIRGVVGHAMIPTALGLVLGLLGALALSGVVEGFLFQVESTDPLTYAGVTGLLLAMALMAAWIPARRTATVDPAEVLDRE